MRNIVIAAARSNRIHKKKIGYKYERGKLGLYKHMQPAIIYNDYIQRVEFNLRQMFNTECVVLNYGATCALLSTVTFLCVGRGLR